MTSEKLYNAEQLPNANIKDNEISMGFLRKEPFLNFNTVWSF